MGAVQSCRCPCHRDSRFWLAPPAVTDPIEALAACEVCASLHRGVWAVYKRPRIKRKWVDPQADGDDGREKR